MVAIRKAEFVSAFINQLNYLSAQEARLASGPHPPFHLGRIDFNVIPLPERAESFSFYLLTEPRFEAEPDKSIDHNKLRERIDIETVTEKELRNLKVHIAKDFFVNELKLNIENIRKLCEEYKGKQPNELKKDAESLLNKANTIVDDEQKSQVRNKAADILYLASLPIKKSELLRNQYALVGSIERLESLFKHIAQKNSIPVELAEDDELLTLTAYYTAKSKNNPNYIINHIPDRLIKEGSNKFNSRVKLLTKHVLLDLKGITSARQVELYLNKHNYLDDFKDAGLTNIWNLFTFRNLTRITFPEEVSGNNPNIRDWFLAKNLKGEESSESTSIGAAWVLEHGVKIFNTEKRVFDIEKMKGIHWEAIFNEYGLSLDSRSINTLELINVGAIKLGVNNLIGHEREDQFHEWDIQRVNMWEEKFKDGCRLIDYVTDFLVEVRLRKNHPEMFKNDGKGKIIPKELEKIKLSKEYESIAPGGLQNSNMGSIQAFKRRHPECFGWSEDKIKPTEVKAYGKFQGEKGEKLFAKGFAFCLFKAGLGKFNPTQIPPIVFTRKELMEWRIKNIKSWASFFKNANSFCKNITSAFDKLCDNNIITAFEMLLGPVNEKTGCFGSSDISPVDIKSKKLLSVEFTDSKTCIIEINSPEDNTSNEIPINLTIDVGSKTHSPEDDKVPTVEELTEIENQLSSESNDFTHTESEGHLTDPTDIFFKEMRDIPLLKREEEIELAKAIELAKMLESENSDFNDLDTDTVKQIISNGIKATNKLVEGNLRLVVSIAKRYQNRGLSLQDLIQEGSIGLIHATKKYDYKLGYKFGTYATWWIRRSVTRALSNKSKTVRIPEHIVQAIRDLNKASKKLRDESVENREPTIDQIAVEMGLSVEKVKGIIAANKRYTSLEAQENDDKKGLGSILEDVKSPNPYKETLHNLLKEDVNKVLKSLTQREREVIILRFGLDGNRAKTLDEVAKIFRITRERIRQIEAKAMIKLQKPGRREKLEGHL